MSEPVTVIIPTWCEVHSAPGMVGAVDRELSRPHQILVIDDDSPDGTADHVRDTVGDRDAVDVVVRHDRSGLASAIFEGVVRADHHRCVVCDADGQHPPRAVQRVAAALDEHQLVLGSRHTDGGEIAADWPLRRRLVSHAAAVLARVTVAASREVSDPLTGLFGVRRPLVEAALPVVSTTGWKAALELLARAPVDDVAEVGFRFRARRSGDSAFDTAAAVSYLRHLDELREAEKRRPDVTVLGQGEHVSD